MDEFDAVSVSTYEASTLAAKLSEKSGAGWDVVAIVPTGSEITAYVKRRAGSGADTASTPVATEDAASTWGTDAAASTPTAAVTEPAGWGSAPETSTSWGSSSGTATTATSAPSDTGASSWGSTASTPATPTAPAPTTPSVPAGWYSDPANRYELRYWDGTAWTEHVSRAGQQYTDPPVA